MLLVGSDLCYFLLLDDGIEGKSEIVLHMLEEVGVVGEIMPGEETFDLSVASFT